MKRFLIVGAALLTSACATTYGELGGLMDDGVTAQRLTGDSYRIVSRGNGATEHGAVHDFAMLRAAETVRRACLTHFIVERGEDRTEVEETATPESTTITVEKVKQKDGTSKAVERVEHTPGSTSLSVRPGADLYIRALAVRPGETPPPGAVSADEVLTFVGPRVKRRKNAPSFVPPVCDGQAFVAGR
ncbi:MAG: hypothetical protein KY446_03765 [Proteobacteria bacterium]|nr:hypothetical protein [Pseudomonadota bacterium]